MESAKKEDLDGQTLYFARLSELMKNKNVEADENIVALLEFIRDCPEEQENESTDEMPEHEKASEEEQEEVGEFPIKDILDMLMINNEEYGLLINRTRNVLRYNRISSFSQLENIRVADMLKWRNMGPKKMGLLLTICNHYGVSLDMVVDDVPAFIKRQIPEANEIKDMFDKALVFAD